MTQLAVGYAARRGEEMAKKGNLRFRGWLVLYVWTAQLPLNGMKKCHHLASTPQFVRKRVDKLCNV